MSPETIVAIIGAVTVAISLLYVIARRLPKRYKSGHYVRKWREIQKLCGDKQDWVHAIIHADMLLDEVLQKKRAAGSSMGERLVSFQDKFTFNDKVWDSHKLAKELRDNVDRKISEAVVKDTLINFRQALRDLGAL